MVESLRTALIITRREVRDQFRDWRIIIPIIALTLIFPMLMNFTAQQAVTFVERYDAPIVGDRLIPFLLMVVGFFPISISLVIALESFVGEKERGSIEPLLASPITDSQLFFGKLMAVTVPPLLASYLGILVYLFGVYRSVGWIPETTLIVQIFILTTVQAIVMVSGAVVVSTQTTSVRAANLLASFIIIPMTFLIQGESIVMFWAQYEILWWAILGLIIIAGLLMRTGISHFNREEMLGRELDNLNFKWGWTVFMSGFKGKATSIWNWYRYEVVAGLRKMRTPILLMAGMFAVALWLGVEQSKVFVLPDELLNLRSQEGVLVEGFDNIALFSVQGIGIIFYHNLRVILLAVLLGMFSFGVIGILITLLPIGLLGYFMGVVAPLGISPLTFMTAFVLPHGILEIPAIILAGAAIYHMGAGLASSASGKSVGEAWLTTLGEWAKIMIGVIIPLFFGAAILEALVTPRVAMMLLGQ